jgi:hypothetical protein
MPSNLPANDSQVPERHPLVSLAPEELDLVLQLVLASGSLKELARVYRVSYPTIRLRVDRLIARLQQITGGTPADPMMQLLADLIERGEITVVAARSVRDLYRRLKEEHREEQKESSNDGTMV